MKKIEVVAAVIKKDGKIFATQRGYGEFKGGWEFPGGKVEAGEKLQDALIREIKEELDVDITVKNLIHTIEYDYPNFHLTMHCFEAELLQDKIILKEHEAAKWLAKNELLSVDWLPADIELIEILQAN